MDLRTMALARLMLDNFPHIKAYWIMLGIQIAQVAQSYGADDIDGTVVHEKIYHDAGADTPQEATVAEIRRLITEAGRVPVERDTLYHEVIRDGTRWMSGQHIDAPLEDYGDGQHAMFAAVQRSDRATIDVLLAAGADIRKRTEWAPGGFGVLDDCDPGMAGFLIERGALLDAHSAARQ